MNCSVDLCESQAQRRGYCAKHYNRWWRNGDPTIVRGGPDALRDQHHSWAGQETTYRAVHKRLTRYRGPARNYQCVDCQGPAQHWSYDGGSALERLSDDGAPYTPELDCYSPRCNSCHKLRDAPGAPNCPRGHPFSGSNLIIRKDGSRCCRTCKLRWDRDQYRKRRARVVTL